MKFTNNRNPLLPLNVHIPDAEAHVMPDGHLYLYGSYDLRDDMYCSDEYHVVETADLLHWEFHEEAALKGADIPWFRNPDAPHYPGFDLSDPTPFVKKLLEEDQKKAKEKAEKEKDDPAPAAPAYLNEPLLFAPDCIHYKGKYYLYFCMIDDSEGVAVSDRPSGPFANPRQLPCGGIDPAIFVDRDEQPWFYWGQFRSNAVRLHADMSSFDENEIVRNVVTEEEHGFHEGSSVRRIGDTYYYVYADLTRGKPTALGYATGSSPLGPFTRRGIIVDNAACDPKSWNNHGSIECVNGQWYVFYHRSSRGSERYRRLCAEKIEILPDGTIPEVLMTSQGLGEPFGRGETIYGYQACALSGNVRIDVDPAGGIFDATAGACPEVPATAGICPASSNSTGTCPEILTKIRAGDEITFRYVQSDTGFTGITISCRGQGEIDVYLDEEKAGHVTAEKGRGTLLASPGTFTLTLRIMSACDLEIFSVTLL